MFQHEERRKKYIKLLFCVFRVQVAHIFYNKQRLKHIDDKYYYFIDSSYCTNFCFTRKCKVTSRSRLEPLEELLGLAVVVGDGDDYFVAWKRGSQRHSIPQTT